MIEALLRNDVNQKMTSQCAPTVLMVNDDVEDIYLTECAFRKHSAGVRFESVNSFNALVQYLEKSTFPSVILLDINLPQKNGFEILKEIKKKEGCARIPVVIFTTFDDEADVAKAYSLGAISYIRKPSSPTALKLIIDRFCKFWFGVVSLPRPL